MRTTLPKLRRTIRRTILEALTPDTHSRYTNMKMMPMYEDAILGIMADSNRLGGYNMYDLASDIGDIMGTPDQEPYFIPAKISKHEQGFDSDTFGAAYRKLESEGKIVMVRMDPRGPVYELA